MDKIVVVSTNNNPDYYFFSPYIKKAWNSYGWKVAVMFTEGTPVSELHGDYLLALPKIEGLKEATVAQAGRLYAANYLPEDSLIMTSDMDLLPLSDYWHPNINDITVYGHDLTWHSFFPMGYCAMSCKHWKQYMNLTDSTERDMLRDANDRSVAHNPFSDKWEEYWDYDWDLLTTRLSPYKQVITFKDRGQIDIAGATLAKGRIDRYNWEVTQNQPEPFIDAHCHNTSVRNPERLESFLKVFNKFHGSL